ncbi:MAG: hypothetical protein M3680_11280 [Myxococcota bacterium]|nr:hypothetical protein [Myxococcota bacterium]
MDTIENITEKANMQSGREGEVTKKVEKVTAAIPSMTWLYLAGGAIGGSLVLKLMGKHSTANFVGEWVPTILMLGLYNKIVKVMGSDRMENQGGISQGGKSQGGISQGGRSQGGLSQSSMSEGLPSY